MCAYNLYHGEYCSTSHWLVEDILRGEWGFDGVFLSDWGAVHDTKTTAESSLDIEMSVTTNFDRYYLAQPLKDAIRAGELPESCLDDKVRRILRLMFRLHMIDLPADAQPTVSRSVVCAVNPGTRRSGTYNTPEHRAAALDTARESIILLKNEDHLLPLEPAKLHHILVVGDNAERLHAPGGGSAEIKALYEISPLMGLKSQLGGNCAVTYARGYEVVAKEIRADVSWQEKSLETAAEEKAATKEELDRLAVRQQELRDEAVRLAADADAVIVVGGLNHDYDVEGYDRDNLTLPYAQDALINALLDVRPDTVVVMRAGSPVSMAAWKDRARAILWEYYDGCEGGNALAEVLLGKVNPSGRLPESLPYAASDCPALKLGDFPGRPLTPEEQQTMPAKLTETFREGVFVGYRYYEKYGVPVQFCFGYGLSYTKFEYRNLSVSRAEDGFTVCFDIANTGARAGKETAELYLGRDVSRADEPDRVLRGFKKVFLQPGETVGVSLNLPYAAFAVWHENERRFAVDAGTYCIYVGRSVEDVRLTTTVSLE